MVDDVRGLLETLGLADRGDVVAAGLVDGWRSAAASTLLSHTGDFSTVALVGAALTLRVRRHPGRGRPPCSDDYAGTGGGDSGAGATLRASPPATRSGTSPMQPAGDPARVFGARGNAAAVDEDFLLDEVLRDP